jgi:hypothetical protein
MERSVFFFGESLRFELTHGEQRHLQVKRAFKLILRLFGDLLFGLK